MSATRLLSVAPAAVAALFIVAEVEMARAGDFASPTSASLDSNFRNTRLSIENNRQNHNNAALARQAANGAAGGAGSLYDEYQNSGAYQNVIWVPLENIGDNNEINVSIGDTQQTADDSDTSASNEISACSDNVLNSSPDSCESN